MSLHLTNTLSKRKEKFTSIDPGKVKIYCCGVTVYDLCHLGHARSYLNWDVLRRYLLWLGYEVTFVQNFTDIDDKIINRATERGCSVNELSNENIKEFYADMDSLGIMRADKMPRATKCLTGIISLINNLEKKGIAYSSKGDVYFSVEKQANYGELSGRDLSGQKENADGRINIKKESKKTSPFDFALWKRAKEGEESYSSPWGEGRPGWHIECSAMVHQELGETIDIHLGGSDLIFPHHENEIAQSEAYTGKKLANYWLHNGMVNVGGEKMSKSLGNFTTIRALLNSGVSPMTLRLFVLQANYRKPLDFTKEGLKAAAKGWEKLNNCLSFGFRHGDCMNWDLVNNEPTNFHIPKEDLNSELSNLLNNFRTYMDDDLNTSASLSTLFDIAHPIRKLNDTLERNGSIDISNQESKLYLSRWKLLLKLSNILGLKSELKPIAEKSNDNLDKDKITQLIYLRKEAKRKKDFKAADIIRGELKSMGVKLIDKPNDITEWENI